MSIIPYLYERPHRLERDFFGAPDFPMPLASRNLFSPDFRPWDMLRHFEQLMKPIEHLSAAMGHMALNEGSITSDNEKFQVNVDVHHFRPEEVSVKVIDRHVLVEGKHEEKQDEHGYVARQFVRRYALPEGCLPDTVQSNLSSDGILTVTAPKVLALPSTGERIVPIAQTGPVKKQISAPE